MLELLKKLVKSANPDATDEQITNIATAIEKSGKLIPEAKYLDIKKARETAEGKVTELQTSLDAFGELNPEDAKKTSEDLKALQQKIADDKVKADADAKTASAAEQSKKVAAAITAKLTDSGAVDAALVVANTFEKAVGADKVELNEDGSLKTDITFAIEAMKTDHPTNFTTVEQQGGGSGAGAGGGKTNTWTSDSVKTWNEGKSDQERIDNAKADQDYAKAAGMTSYITAAE